MIYYLLPFFGTLAYLFFLALPFLITGIKKRRQLGKVWSGPVRATLSIGEKQLSCRHCGGPEFEKREGILATSWASFFHFSCWNQSAACYTCTQCGSIEWFVKPQEKEIAFKRVGRD